MSDQVATRRLADTVDAMAWHPRDVVYRKAATELRNQHSRIEALEADRDSWIDQCSQRVADWSEAQARIEADEALMRQAVDALQVNATWPFPKKREDAITALRKRLESSK